MKVIISNTYVTKHFFNSFLLFFLSLSLKYHIRQDNYMCYTACAFVYMYIPVSRILRVSRILVLSINDKNLRS